MKNYGTAIWLIFQPFLKRPVSEKGHVDFAVLKYQNTNTHLKDRFKYKYKDDIPKHSIQCQLGGNKIVETNMAAALCGNIIPG